MESQISLEQIKEFEEIYNSDKTNKMIENAITKNGLENACINRDVIIDNQPVFNIELPESRRYDQQDSYKCWIYAGSNLIKHNVAKNLNMNVMDLELSNNQIAFFDKLEKSNNVYENIINAEDMDFGTRQIDLVTNLLGNEMGMRVGRFTSQESVQERAQIRTAFADGEMLQALVAIRCLDEGVNIPSIKTAFILASSTNPKEYIQRRGRVLRKFPGKDYAVIFDFITLPFPVDTLNFQRDEVINSTKGLIKREIIRMLDFAEIAENPSETYDLIYDLKHGFGITEEDLKEEEVNGNVV